MDDICGALPSRRPLLLHSGACDQWVSVSAAYGNEMALLVRHNQLRALRLSRSPSWLVPASRLCLGGIEKPVCDCADCRCDRAPMHTVCYSPLVPISGISDAQAEESFWQQRSFR